MSIRVTGLRSLTKKLNRIRNKAKPAIAKRNKELAQEFVNLARSFAPQGRTGALKRNILYIPEKEGMEYVVGSFRPNGMPPYNIYQHEGVSPNPNYGFIPQAGAGRSGEGYMSPFAPKKHPGFMGKFFMLKAYNQMKEKYPLAMSRVIRNVIMG